MVSLFQTPNIDIREPGSALVKQRAKGTMTALASFKCRIERDSPSAGRIFEFVHGLDVAPAVVTQQNLNDIVSALLNSIRDKPHIAEKAQF